MAEEIGFENGRNSNFEGLVTLTLTLDRVIRHTVVHHSSTSTYIPNFIEIEETFCGRTDGRTYGRDVRTDIFSPSNIIRSTFGSRPNKTMKQYNKPRKSCTLFGLGFLETIPSPWLGFLRGIFLVNHLASTDNLTRTTKRHNTLQRKLTIHKKGP